MKRKPRPRNNGDALPPMDLECEALLIGGLIRGFDVQSTDAEYQAACGALALIDATNLIDQRYQNILAAIRVLAEGGRFDVVALKNALNQKWPTVSWFDLLIKCIDSAPHGLSAPSDANRLRTLAVQRDALDALDLARHRIMGGDPAAALDDLRDDATRLAAALPGGAGSRGVVLTRLADVQPEVVSWLWPARIPLGKLTLLAGDPGLGKSFLTLDLAARVSTGVGFPDAPGERFEPGGVVLLSAEDGLADTIRPRLDAAGADATRVVAISAVKRGGREATFSLDRDLPALVAAINATRNCRLVVIDPVSAYCGGRIDAHRNDEVRALLAPLAALAAEHDVAIVCVTHLSKGSGGGPAIYRAMGSIAFAAAARAVWGVVKDRDDPARRLLLPVKMNLTRDCGGLACTIGDNGCGAACVRWESDPVSVTADDAMAWSGNGGGTDDQPSAVDDAADWLKEALADGPIEAGRLQAMAEQAGHTWGTVKRAKAKAGAESFKAGFGDAGRWAWRLRGATAPDTETLRPLDDVAPLSVFDPENAVFDDA